MGISLLRSVGGIVQIGSQLPGLGRCELALNFVNNSRKDGVITRVDVAPLVRVPESDPVQVVGAAGSFDVALGERDEVVQRFLLTRSASNLPRSLFGSPKNRRVIH